MSEYPAWEQVRAAAKPAIRATLQAARHAEASDKFDRTLDRLKRMRDDGGRYAASDAYRQYLLDSGEYVVARTARKDAHVPS